MSWFELIADRKIRDAIDEGAFDNLPGKGKPLQLDADARVPAELRAAYRLMKEAKILPDWIQLAKEIRQREENWAARVESFARGRQTELEERSRARDREGRLDRARDRFLYAAAEEFRERNRMIDRLNLIVPTPAQQQLRLNLQEEMAGLEARFPRFQPHPAGAPLPWAALLEEHRPPTQLANRMPRKIRRDSIG